MHNKDNDMNMSELRRLSGLSPITEKAVSQKQQQFMGMVHAMQTGDKVKGASPELKQAAKSMSKKDAADFASTKHKGLPQHVSESVLTEGTLDQISHRYAKEINDFMDSGMMDADLYHALHDHYYDDMPNGVKRGADTQSWVADRFAADTGSTLMPEISELSAPMMDEGDIGGLNELARLAGLTTEGLGDDLSYKAGQAAGTVKRGFDATVRGAGEMADEFKRGMSNAQNPSSSAYPDEMQRGIKPKQGSSMGTKPAGISGMKPSPSARGIAPIAPQKPPSDFTVTEPIGLDAYMRDERDRLPSPRRPEQMGQPEQIMQTPQIDENAELNQMRRIAGLTECGDMSMDQQDSLNVSTNMSSDGTKDVTINARGSKADALIQMLKMAGLGAHDDHAQVDTGVPEMDGMEDGAEHIVIMASPEEEMMDEGEHEGAQYANTPDEGYQSVQAITRQGNDLNREKKQFNPDRARDNPMAIEEEFNLEESLAAMLEGIKIKEGGAGGIDAETPYRDEKTGKMITPPRGATMPPPDSEFPPGDRRNMINPMAKPKLVAKPTAPIKSTGVRGEETGVYGATMPPADSPYAPGDIRNTRMGRK